MDKEFEFKDHRVYTYPVNGLNVLHKCFDTEKEAFDCAKKLRKEGKYERVEVCDIGITRPM